jgi:hypothetical protein
MTQYTERLQKLSLGRSVYDRVYMLFFLDAFTSVGP